MTSARKIRRLIDSALDEGALIRLTSSAKHADPVDMIVVGVGSDWVLGVTIVDGYFDGHHAMRLADVRGVETNTNFFARMARTLPDWPPRLEPEVDLDSTRGVLRWFAARYPILAFEKAHERRAVWIGTLVEQRGKHFSVHEISPRAEWLLSPLWYRRRDVTAIAGGGRYNIALQTVAGAQPPIDPSRSGDMLSKTDGQAV